VPFAGKVLTLFHWDIGIDNINVTAINIPPNETEPPSLAPSSLLSAPTTGDICITDVMYDHRLQQTVPRKCFDLVATLETMDHNEKDIGNVCVEVMDNQRVQLVVQQKGNWNFLNASAWTGESLDDAYVDRVCAHHFLGCHSHCLFIPLCTGHLSEN
jgi:hypothetical protein